MQASRHWPLRLPAELLPRKSWYAMKVNLMLPLRSPRCSLKGRTLKERTFHLWELNSGQGRLPSASSKSANHIIQPQTCIQDEVSQPFRGDLYFRRECLGCSPGVSSAGQCLSPRYGRPRGAPELLLLFLVGIGDECAVSERKWRFLQRALVWQGWLRVRQGLEPRWLTVRSCPLPTCPAVFRPSAFRFPRETDIRLAAPSTSRVPTPPRARAISPSMAGPPTH
jgi:hypothetical protein